MTDELRTAKPWADDTVAWNARHHELVQGLENQAALLSAPAAARLLEISPEAVTRAIRQGRLRAVWVGRQWLITRADLNAWEERR